MVVQAQLAQKAVFGNKIVTANAAVLIAAVSMFLGFGFASSVVWGVSAFPALQTQKTKTSKQKTQQPCGNTQARTDKAVDLQRSRKLKNQGQTGLPGQHSRQIAERVAFGRDTDATARDGVLTSEPQA
ncbi:hypothetical protein [Polaromonas glacialis]|uniref:hypothetical protein n=1 Tax=Polaromonas glacialis TaxID=866564 RepID=UPI0004960165|nr:hypothetical protein [Polaromonas glacialis]